MIASPGALLRSFLMAPLSPSTWGNLLYVLLAFPLGLLYFVFLVIGGSVGLGTALLGVGIPLLLVTVGAWWVFAALERALARSLLGIDVPFAPRPWESVDRPLAKVGAHFTAGSTWRDLAFVLLKFPLGAASTMAVAAVGGAAAALIVSPALGPWSTGRAAYVGAWRIDHGWEAAVSLLAGLLALLLTLTLANAFAALWRLLARALLGERPASATRPPDIPGMRSPDRVPTKEASP